MRVLTAGSYLHGSPQFYLHRYEKNIGVTHVPTNQDLYLKYNTIVQGAVNYPHQGGYLNLNNHQKIISV
jgi:hypothetical protein